LIIEPTNLSAKEIYKFLIGAIVPRPIAWVSTISKQGTRNLAPFSFFTAASTRPPMLCISVGPGEEEREGTLKDTMANIQDTEEFVVNVVTLPLANKMHKSSGNFQPEVDEFREVGVTPIDCISIKPPRVKESPINMECKLEKIVPLGHDTLIIGRIVHFHIDDHLYLNGKIDLKGLQPVGRLAGNYSLIDKLFDLPNSDFEK
jgi:flavin reductase (DIM6/NTAB) family NADH-FMN oxidoreductase RutF